MTEYMEANTAATWTPERRELPASIVIPPIRGEMVHLRPATMEDLPKLDQLDAYYGATRITGKDENAERAVVHAWVARSVAWTQGQAPSESGVGDPEARRTIAWAILTDADHDMDHKTDASATGNVIGMIFLIDIDGWSRSARIQIILGKDYRGRGYSRDAMPRVMTYGFAPEPAGLGMHRIWVSVPEQNTRSVSVYQSLGFVPSGTSRDALWDPVGRKYQDLIVMDTLVDEYDPIRSLEAFGMHLIEDNPGVQEALSAREHSIAIQQRSRAVGSDRSDVAMASDGEAVKHESHTRESAYRMTPQEARERLGLAQVTPEPSTGESHAYDSSDEESNWPYGQSERKTSKDAWWRTLGRGRKRESDK
ncbi:GNAT family acetyltransferase [Bifidobacterium sp. UTCIF-37]|uniref:GNAT family N-acetyltransferase n=1 Tax=unclassified Bifidobacterium TaxID=2608897 RepID=UPI00112D361F|nr:MULTISPECIES: GNAT family N-acetyltransferase [unclassified Bifidobacterium]TPF86038.1 GNAT family acetyltransferase [Bifidobacterium sp. UTCIF-37]TPF88237.1 GNAT family acetyltransferase [Bifidobacterium sp. UTCIF-38]